MKTPVALMIAAAAVCAPASAFAGIHIGMSHHPHRHHLPGLHRHRDEAVVAPPPPAAPASPPAPQGW